MSRLWGISDIWEYQGYQQCQGFLECQEYQENYAHMGIRSISDIMVLKNIKRNLGQGICQGYQGYKWF